MNLDDLNRLLENHRLVLASSSPRRVKLLKDAGYDFRQIIPNLDEDGVFHDDPYRLAVILAEHKISAVIDLLAKEEIALAADTIVLLKGEVLGKPRSPEEAVEMLSRLSGNMHTVCTAVALSNSDGRMVSGYELTRVFFNKLNPERVQEYVASGEPLDKAGAYGIQASGGFLVDRIEGNLDNVIGLPMTLLGNLAGRLINEKG